MMVRERRHRRHRTAIIETVRVAHLHRWMDRWVHGAHCTAETVVQIDAWRRQRRQMQVVGAAQEAAVTGALQRIVVVGRAVRRMGAGVRSAAQPRQIRWRHAARVCAAAAATTASAASAAAAAGRTADTRAGRSPLVAQLLLATPLGTPIREPHLDARLGQLDLGGQPFARKHVRIVGALELLFQIVDLLVRERGAVALQLPLEAKPSLVVAVGAGDAADDRAAAVRVVTFARSSFVRVQAHVQLCWCKQKK